MYSLDINFLNDRVIRPVEAGPVAPRGKASSLPLYLGLAVALLLPALAGGLWFFLQSRNAELTRQQAELDSQLAAADALLKEVESINTQVRQINEQNEALATVFDRIKPWSAILQDIRDRVPNGVQIAAIEQTPAEVEATTTAPPAPAASPAPTPAASPPAEGEAAAPAGTPPPAAAPEPPPPVIRITGVAQNFDNVNDFLLTLQRSPFLDGENTRLVSAALIDNPTQIELAESAERSSQVTVTLPKVVEYEIQSTLTPIPTSELMQELDRTLAVGLAARIQELRDKGVIQQ